MKKCDICDKSVKVSYRFKSNEYKNWVFCCKDCWKIISKHAGYCYGGTRKSS